MAQQKVRSSRPDLREEVAGVIFLFIALFLFLSLVSDQPAARSNWCGQLGHTMATVLGGVAGWGAYALPLLLVGTAVLFFRPGTSLHRLPHLTLGITGCLFSFCGLASTLARHESRYLDAGGFLGKTLYTLLVSVAGHWGSVLVLFLVLLVSLMLALRFSPYLFTLKTGRKIAGAGEVIAGAVKKHGEERQARPNVKSTASSSRSRKKKKSGEVQEPEMVVAAAVATPDPAPSAPSVPVVKMAAKQTASGSNDEEFAAKPVARGEWRLPPLSLLRKNENGQEQVDNEVYFKVSKQLEQKLKNFGVSGKVVGISPGPVVTTYEYAPAPGVKINKIAGLSDDLALGLKAQSVRVVGSVPGKAALGIEIPNETRQIVFIREMLGTETYRNQTHKLTIALGLDVIGNLSMANLAKMPHLLIAGATGAGKSVGINTIIASILYNATPQEVRFLMVDPKRIELSGYEGIPHLLHPVVVDPKLASRALNWAVREMERRYRLLEEARVKSFDSYNESQEDKLPYIVIIVDELADLMMVASKDVEASIARLAQMARAAGIHMILATQRPSVDVLTGLIKANFPTRISFKVSSKIDSRTILDASGAEHLLGAGDMLFLAPGSSNLKRIHGAYISEKETIDIVEFWKTQSDAAGCYDETIVEEIEKENGSGDSGDKGDVDDRYDEAVEIVTQAGQASISMIQRRLRIGYNRAARMIEMMEQEGVVGPADGAKPREVIVRGNYE